MIDIDKTEPMVVVSPIADFPRTSDVSSTLEFRIRGVVFTSAHGGPDLPFHPIRPMVRCEHHKGCEVCGNSRP